MAKTVQGYIPAGTVVVAVIWPVWEMEKNVEQPLSEYETAPPDGLTTLACPIIVPNCTKDGAKVYEV